MIFYQGIVEIDELIVPSMTFLQKPVILFFLLTALCLCQCQRPQLSKPRPAIDPSQITEGMAVLDLLLLLGEEKPEHYLDQPSEKLIEVGKEIIFTGKTTHPETGQETVRISDYFYCTDCHTTSPETSNLSSVADPVARLDFLQEQEQPLVPGSTFAGMVNRETWYNGDYAKKYRFSPSVQAARNNLRKAIELCSRECSQGRDPESWETEAMLAYFWSLQWKVADLGFTGADLAELKRRALNQAEHAAITEDIRNRYAIAAPATFGEMPEDSKAGYPVEREVDVEKGRIVFQRSCLHCHGADGASEYFFGDKVATWEKLARRFQSPSKKSLYGLIRLGTKPEKDKRPYMPNFTKERLSDEQIEDLRAYIEKQTGESAE